MPTSNTLLASLPAEDRARLQPHLRPVTLKPRQVVSTPQEPLRDVLFPEDGVISLTVVMRDGATVEIATIGREGVVGIESFLGSDVAWGETMLQVPGGDATALAVPAFHAELARRGALHAAVQRYAQGFTTLVMQSTACMALHAVQERCARWLLMTHDRMQRDEFQLSQEFLAMMLGSTRPTVNVVASTLQRAGFIRYSHGRITILDREGLEQSACECYGTVRGQFERLGL